MRLIFWKAARVTRTLRKRRRPRRRGLHPSQRPVFTAVERGGTTTAELGDSAKSEALTPWLYEWVNGDSVLISDAHRSYAVAAKSLELRHEVINASKGKRKRGHLHLQTVNQRHSVMKGTINHIHRGVGTGYLNNYMNWLSLNEFRIDKTHSPNFIQVSLNYRDTLQNR